METNSYNFLGIDFYYKEEEEKEFRPNPLIGLLLAISLRDGYECKI